MADVDISRLTKNRAYRIEMYSFSNTRFKNLYSTISFPAFVTDFTDSFKSNWNEEEVMGKMDPVVTFKNTRRSISLSFDVPSDSIETAMFNLDQIDFLIKGLYPIYDKGKYGTAVMVSPPMFRVRFSNLVRNSGQRENGKTLRTGLLSYIQGFDFKPAVDSGFFVDKYGNLYPKLIKVNLALNIIHEQPLGNYKDGDLVKPRVNFEYFPHKQPKGIPPAVRSGQPNGAASRQATNNAEQSEQDAANDTCLGEE